MNQTEKTKKETKKISRKKEKLKLAMFRIRFIESEYFVSYILEAEYGMH